MAQYLVVLGGMPLEVTDLEIRDLSPPKKPDPDAGKQKYEPTERETTALDRYRAQKATAPAAPRMKVIDGKKKVTPDHPDQPLAWALLREAPRDCQRRFWEWAAQSAGKCRFAPPPNRRRRA
jgi:hypothetical protein